MDNEQITINVEKIDIGTTKDVNGDISVIIEKSQEVAYRAIDLVLLKRNWLIGKRIHEEIMMGSRKDNYGKELIESLSRYLSKKYKKGFDVATLYKYVKFYTVYKNIFASLKPKSFLSWSHYKILVTVNDENARSWYEKEACECNWTIRTLQRNINTQYYYRLLASKDKGPVIKEMEEKTSEYQLHKLEHIKNPTILEFLDINDNPSLRESDLESAIISNLNKFIMEMGKGYCFVGRQHRIHSDNSDYYVDLVFYNVILRCYVLIDLKVNKITHQDIGQMDMYVRMFDELIKSKDDNPTLGIVLCSETDADIAKYSILRGNEQLFATKYKLYLPSEERLKAEIEYQKELFESRNK